MKTSNVLYSIVLLSLCYLTHSEKVEFGECDDDEVKCEIHDVNITPCPEAKNNGACEIKKGESAGIAFDFTPEFSSTAPKIRIYWANSAVDLPFLGMDIDACKVTKCPIEANKKTSLLYNLQVSKKFPSKLYPIKVKLWNENDNMCCFTTSIKLVKS